MVPTVFCVDTQQGVAFNGIVPDAKTLVIDSIEGATLDGNPVDDWLTYFEGGIADYSLLMAGPITASVTSPPPSRSMAISRI